MLSAPVTCQCVREHQPARARPDKQRVRMARAARRGRRQRTDEAQRRQVVAVLLGAPPPARRATRAAVGGRDATAVCLSVPQTTGRLQVVHRARGRDLVGSDSVSGGAQRLLRAGSASPRARRGSVATADAAMRKSASASGGTSPSPHSRLLVPVSACGRQPSSRTRRQAAGPSPGPAAAAAASPSSVARVPRSRSAAMQPGRLARLVSCRCSGSGSLGPARPMRPWPLTLFDRSGHNARVPAAWRSAGQARPSGRTPAGTQRGSHHAAARLGVARHPARRRPLRCLAPARSGRQPAHNVLRGDGA